MNQTDEAHYRAKNTSVATVKSFQELESKTTEKFSSRFSFFTHMTKSARKDIAAFIAARSALQTQVDFGTANGRNDLDQLNAQLQLRESHQFSEIISSEMSTCEPSIIGMEDKAAMLARQFLATPG